MSHPFEPRALGRHRDGFPPELPADATEIPVVRRIRREVAERLTRATRTHESATGRVMTAAEQQATTRDLITAALDAYAAEEMNAGRPPLRPDAESRVGRAAADMLLGAGGLQPLLNDERVEDIHANGADEVFVRYTDGTRVQVAPIADTDAEMVELIRRLAADAGRAETGGEGAEERRWDRAAPILKLQMPDGSRLHAIMSVTPRPALSIRRHHYLKVTLPDLEQLGTLNPVLREVFAAAVHARLNTLVAGRTGAGKTTLLRALAAQIPAHERIVTIEDTYELALNADRVLHPDVVPMQSREANVEGEGAIDMSELFRSGLRMSPDRVIVGEIRGHEVIPMLNAMSQGNDGSLGTIHASSSAGVFKKLALYAAQAPERLEPATTNLLVSESVHLVVHLGLTADNRRVVTSVREVVDADGLSVASNEIFRPGPDGRAVPAAPPSTALLSLLAGAGFDRRLLDEARTAPGGGWAS
ncbi:Flp pilus assembly CpaF family ATPase [Krasilnikovia cinnamomea]|uniref:Flp pilus assembly CpaF family ATPase n=1 Tax=Krasilnikovia cinnamomea TaxID=349313 RepID=A0A4Q7ZFA6_9ACTN|nr:ATPase, T2SS/T4P/T4SS family [Krasilnikovia cinnamomea]RZU48775.1 Flp pilus assembly CpaF family ATPase [Krasilnikovia cinnamomea]